MAEPVPESNSFPIVGIGASAGGLEALTSLLETLPPDTRLAFVVTRPWALESAALEEVSS